MKKTILFKSILFLFTFTLLEGVPSANAQTSMALPPHDILYSGSVRGYWFTAPTDFQIVGLRVSPEAGLGAQNIQVLKINGAIALYPELGTNFTTLAYIQEGVNGQIQNVNINITAGDVIGILGSVGNSVAVSYSSSEAPFSSSINGFPVVLNRFLFQGQINYAAASDYSTESTGNIGRIEMYYSCVEVSADGILTEQVSDCLYNFGLDNALNVNSCQWDFGDGSPILSGITTSHAYAAGSYIVTATITNDCGSVALIKAISCISTAVETNKTVGEDLILYPNPASNLLSLKSSGLLNIGEVRVYDLMGHLVYVANANGQTEYLLNVSQLAFGIYSLHIRTNNGLLVEKLEVGK